MSILSKLRDEAETYIAQALLGLVLLAATAATYLAGAILPPELIHWLGPQWIARILICLLSIAVILAAWIWHLRPSYVFHDALGVFVNKRTGQYHCAKCDKSPLQTTPPGWYCVKCHLLYDNPEFVRLRDEEIKRRIREEDAKVKALNQSRRI